MKRFVKIIVSLVMMIMSLDIPVQATELATPSGIAYSDIQTEIEQYIKERESGLASVEIAVFHQDETIYEGYFGYADIENNMIANEETVYEWGSCSKLLVWISVMQLYEQGLIELEADIQTYLPEGFLTKLQYNEPITILHLMNHTAGWQETIYTVEVSEEKNIVSLEEALKNTEPPQVYIPGEYTAYSNWGTALAAFMVQQVSGMDYAEYVHKNILEPLNMHHTSIGADYRDNEWVKAKREELKSYMIMEDIHDSYGQAIRYILLYPAGSATGTLADFARFAKAFTSDDCLLFEKKETRDRLFTATSYYGDSNIGKNYHGLWSFEHAVQTMGHAGNTTACSSMLQFDPTSGLGVVVMTNECGETAFNYGIPSLLYGNYEARAGFDGKTITFTDISGMYTNARGFYKGFPKIFSYIGSLMPITKGEAGNTFQVVGMEMHRIADKQWIQDDGNGMRMLLYEDERNGQSVLEMMSTDYVRDPFYWYKAAAIIGFLLLSASSGVILCVKLLVYLGKRKRYNKYDKSVLNVQIIHLLSGIALMILIGGSADITRLFAIMLCVFFGVIGVFSFINSIVLSRRTVRMMHLRIPTVIKNIFWILDGAFIVGFIMFFQLYNFWSC